jgi:hypothetical protein
VSLLTNGDGSVWVSGALVIFSPRNGGDHRPFYGTTRHPLHDALDVLRKGK